MAGFGLKMSVSSQNCLFQAITFLPACCCRVTLHISKQMVLITRHTAALADTCVLVNDVDPEQLQGIVIHEALHHVTDSCNSFPLLIININKVVFILCNYRTMD